MEEFREEGCDMTAESATLYTVQGHEKEVGNTAFLTTLADVHGVCLYLGV